MKQDEDGDDGSMSQFDDLANLTVFEVDGWNGFLLRNDTLELLLFVDDCESRSKLLGEMSRLDEDKDTDVFFDDVIDGLDIELESKFNDFGLIDNDNLLCAFELDPFE